MEGRFYHTQRIDLERLARELERLYAMQGYQVQYFGNLDQMTLQMKKGGDFAAIIGMQKALTLTMQRMQDGVNAIIGQQKWADKAAIGAVGLFILWPLAFTAGAGAIQQAMLGSQVLKSLDSFVYQQDPSVQINFIPAAQYQQAGPELPPATEPWQQQQWQATQPWAHKVICPHCQAPNDQGGSFCMKCGKSLAPQELQKVFCPVCHAEANSLATFCTQCGSPLSQEDAGV